MPAIASETARWRRPRLSLRLRLTLLYGACFLVAGAALLAITYGLVAHQTVGQSRSFVISRTRVGTGGKTSGVVNGAVTSASGDVGASTARSSNSAPEPAPPPGALIQHVQGSGQRQMQLLVNQANAALTTQRNQSRTALLEESGVALAIMALVSIGLGYLMAGRALAPLRTMNTRARAITEENLHERLGIGSRSDELGELASTFDDLLARLERAFGSQRRFVANASHELRTPITLERALVEVALADPGATIDSLRATCARVLAATEHQERIIEALLTLARSQAGVASRETIDLAGLVRDGLAGRAAGLAGFDLTVELAPAVVRGDRALLERMVANLLDNAIVHNAAAAPWVRVQSAAVDGTAELRVANGGALIPGARREELFEPFWRLDGQRTGVGGLGLGLSIVKAIVTAHRGTVEAIPLEAGGLELRLAFSAVSAPEADAAEAPLHAAAPADLAPQPFG